MSKKLMFLISTSGKSSEQIATDAWAAFIKYQATALGLSRCKVCGEYRGKAIDEGKVRKVSCICAGILCTQCQRVQIRRPISNHFNEKDGKIWHTPYFLHICSGCSKIG